MKLLFLDSEVVHRWVLHLVSKNTERQLNQTWARAAEAALLAITAHEEGKFKPCCTIGSAAEVVTRLFKRPNEYFVDECRRFDTRKLLSREAFAILREGAELLAPTVDHFKKAEELWLEWCNSEAKESFAQFSDYVDSALILNPPEAHNISCALLGHVHVGYILRKEKSGLLPQILPVGKF